MVEDDDLLLLSDHDIDELNAVAEVEAEQCTSRYASSSAPSEPGAVDVDGTDTKARKKKKILNRKKLEKLQKEHDMRGIIYVSRIPPHMKPGKLRQLLSPYGEIVRIYCAPEDKRLQRNRKREGKNTGKNFTEGWVEFADKRIAKRTALMLNGQPIGGKRRSAYHFDLWCLKYLPKFKWDHLTEQMRYERAVREQRLTNEISAAKRERDFYLGRVDKAKEVAAIRERRERQGVHDADSAEGTGHDAAAGGEGTAASHEAASEAGASAAGGAGGAPAERRKKRHFKQRKAKADPVTSADAPQLPADLLQLVAPRKKARLDRGAQ